MTFRDLLLIEFIKSRGRNTKFFITCILIVLSVLITCSLIVKIDISSAPEKHDTLQELNVNPIFSFKIYFDNLSIVSVLVLCIYFISSITNDIQNGVFKKHFIDGLKEDEIILSKLIIAFLFSLFIAITSHLFFILIGNGLSGIPVHVFMHTEIAALFLKIILKNFYCVLFAILIAFLLKSIGKAITFLILAFILEKVILFYLNNHGISHFEIFLPISCINEYFNTPTNKNFIAVLLFINLFLAGMYFSFDRRNI